MGRVLTFFVLLLLIIGHSLAQTTGKISGQVTDSETGEDLIGVNIIIEGTSQGAATDINGEFFIINITPGEYSLKVSSIGYTSKRIEGVNVSVNRTTFLDITLSSEALQLGEEVVVTASKVSIKKDQTSSIRNVSSQDIESLPIESAKGVVALQPGYVQGRFRGGRLGETNYMIDGISTFNAHERSTMMTVDPDALQEVEVITGIFSAKYGNAQSGVVNMITKEGGNQFHGKVEGFWSNYYTTHTDEFIGLKPGEVNRNQDYKVMLHGPIIKDHLTFFVNSRFESKANHLNGIRRFLVTDKPIYEGYPDGMYNIYHSGDGEYVPMNWEEKLHTNAKLTYKSDNLKLSLMYLFNDGMRQNYNANSDPDNKYKPDGRPVSNFTEHMYTAKLNHILSNSMFYELKFSYLNAYDGEYVYENPLDSRYINGSFFNGTNVIRTGFNTGGQSKTHRTIKTDKYLGRLDFVWQASQNHYFETGVEAIIYEYDYADLGIQNRYRNTSMQAFVYEPEVMADSTVFSDIYQKSPTQIAAWLSDKMEYEEMVLSLGVRMEYFNPNTTYPSNYRNPSNNLSKDDQPEWMSTYPEADAQLNFAPRIGFSYQLAETALLRFSYGHFYQYPQHHSLYRNNSYIIDPQDYATTIGNPNVRPEKTVSYEMGLWQALNEFIDFEVALFYRDMYDLSTVNIITTYNNTRYGLYGNKDYANSRGLELKAHAEVENMFAEVNYTLQYTRGNADNPTNTFTRAGNSQDPIPTLIAMSWDERHTLNFTAGYKGKNFSVSTIGYFGSGRAYSWTPIDQNKLNRINLMPNNAKQDYTFSMDLNAHYDLPAWNDYNFRISLRVYNLLDNLNDQFVDGTTGRANEFIIRDVDKLGFASDFSTYEESIINPAAWSAPREVKLGIGIVF